MTSSVRSAARYSGAQRRWPIALLALFAVFFITCPAYAAEAPWKTAYTAEPFAGGVIRDVYCDLAGYMEGSFGGLLLSAAVLIAVGGAAFGDFTNAKTAMVVGLSAATIAAGVSLYFGDLGCGGGQQQGGAQQGGGQQGGGDAPGGDNDIFGP